MKESTKKNTILGHHKNIIGLLFPDPQFEMCLGRSFIIRSKTC
jgi:hypothetical protein